MNHAAEQQSTLDFEVAVIGGGPAGLTAAVTLGRARRSVVVIDSGAPRNAPSDGVHMFLTRDGITPADATGLTDVPGVWVAGNVTDLVAGVVTAAAGGMAAAAAVNADLIAEDTRNAVVVYRESRRPLTEIVSAVPAERVSAS